LTLAALALAQQYSRAARLVDQLYPYAYYSTIDGFWLAGRYGWYSPMGFTERPEPNFCQHQARRRREHEGQLRRQPRRAAPAYWDGWRSSRGRSPPPVPPARLLRPGER